MKTADIWFDGEKIYCRTDDNRILWQSLLYYRRLMNATDDQRLNYTVSAFGIHWPELDEDISFESFEYENPEPKGISRLLLTLPELNLSALAKRLSIQPSLLISYRNGTCPPSKEHEDMIINEIHKIGKEFQLVTYGNKYD